MAIPPPTLLTDLPGGGASQANGVSATGAVIVGLANTAPAGTPRAVYWPRTSPGVYGNPVNIGILPGGTNSAATAISANGLAIVGEAVASDGLAYGFVWTQADGMFQLPKGSGTFVADSTVTGCSQDGSTIIGSTPYFITAFGNLPTACYWTGTNGQTLTPLNAPDFCQSTATACSADASIIVGQYVGLDAATHGVRWNATGGGYGLFTALPLFNGIDVQPIGISSDGSVILGNTTSFGDGVVVTSTDNGPWTSIGAPIGATIVGGDAISSDGTLISGTSSPAPSNGILFWSSVTGFEDVSGDNGHMLGFAADNSIAVGVDSLASFGAQACWWGLPAPPATSILSMDDVIVTSLATESPCTAAQFVTAPTIGPSLGLRWSDTRGQTFGNAVAQQFSTDPLSSYQWNRTGYARDRVFELFWSAAFKTALNGAFVDVRTMKS